jgi:hypothetical protein
MDRFRRFRKWLSEHRSFRAWLSVVGNVFVPMVVGMSGASGGLYVALLCVAFAVWTLLWFSPELSKLGIPTMPQERPIRPAWLVLPGIASLAAIALGWAIFFHHVLLEPESLTYADLGNSYLAHKHFRLADLARFENVVTDRTFEDCTFYGPGFVNFDAGTYLNDPLFVMPDKQENLSPVTAFIEVADGTYLFGGVTFINCTFQHCTFRHIQVIGDHAKYLKFRAWMSTARRP